MQKRWNSVAAKGRSSCPAYNGRSSLGTFLSQSQFSALTTPQEKATGSCACRACPFIPSCTSHTSPCAFQGLAESSEAQGRRQGGFGCVSCTQERMAPPPPASHPLPKLAERGLGGLCQQGQAHERGRCQCRACRTGTHVALGQSTLGTSMRTGTNLVYTPDSLFSACRS